MGRWVVAAGLLIASVAAPADLPGPLDALAPAPSAEAASGTVVAGTPDPCSAVDPDPDDSSTTWTVVSGTNADDRECVLTADAVCPSGHVKPAAGNPPPYLCYPSSCSDRSFNVNELANYRMPRPGDDTSGTDPCRVFQVTECRAGIGPTHKGLCRYVQRRSWTCPNDYHQHNRFNTCYQAHTAAPEGTPPPCDSSTGAPSLPLLDCDDYAGDDYDDSETCTDLSSDLIVRSGGAAAAYWCEFDASDLNIACHRNPVPSGTDCEQSTGVCLKRESTARGQQLRALGGCNAIARNIECARHQADYADKVGTGINLEELARRIRADGCEPCRVMPFEPLDPRQCPDSVLTGQPATIDLNNDQQRSRAGISPVQRAAFQNKEDAGRPRGPIVIADSDCQDLPPGRLTWSTPSFTGLAMVNTRVRLEMTWDFYDVSQAPAPALSNRGLGVCFVRPYGWRQPSFYLSVSVKPLWPEDDPADPNDSDDRSLIEKLFGSGSLQWWDNLSTAEQTNRTTAFYATSTVGAVDIPCSLQIPIWCVWEPQQAGYYSLTATGALFMSKYNEITKNPENAGSVPADWHSSLLTKAELDRCHDWPTPDDCLLTLSSTDDVGVFIKNKPIGIQVREVRVVSRTPSS